MKKLGLLVMPFMAVSFLASCGSSKPTEDITHKFTFTGEHCTINGKTSYSHDIFESDKDVKYTIVPDNEYSLPKELDYEEIEYDYETGVITINEIKSDIDIVVTAHPIGETYTVSYSAGEGKVTSANPDTVEANKPINEPTLEDRPGYDEEEVIWLDKDGNEFDFNEGTNENIVLYAKWGEIEKVKVHFVETSLVTIDKDVDYDGHAIYYTPSQEGFTFDGWYEEDPEVKPTAKEFNFSTQITSETYVYAKWISTTTKDCTVKFVNCSATYKGTPVGDDGITLNVPTNLAYYVKFEMKAADDVCQKLTKVTLDQSVDYRFTEDDGELFINLQEDVIATGEGANRILNDSSWEQIKAISEIDKADEIFKIGDEKQIKLIENRQEQPFSHTVRIIGFNHDNLSDGSGTAGITFEFKNLITKSDEDVYKIAWDDSGHNYDYRSSTLNTTLNDESEGILSMLPLELQESGIIKQVDKKVGVCETPGPTPQYEPLSYDPNEGMPYPKLFVLAHDEITTTSADNVTPNEGTIYQFYSSNKSADRIKNKVNGTGGLEYWLRSPSTKNSISPWNVTDEGEFNEIYYTNFPECPIAPAFCI